jgi:hypothetical protein
MVFSIWLPNYGNLKPGWQNKIRNLRQYLRGWAKHTAGAYKKEKQRLISLLDAIDKKAESNSLSDNEIHMKYYLKERLVHLLREEEIKWYERAKVKTLLQGDNNTHFFIWLPMANIANSTSSDYNKRMV